MNKKSFFFYFFITVTTIGWSQSNTENPIEDHDFTRQIWIDLQPYWTVTNTSKIIGEFSYRTVHPESWHRIITRVSKEFIEDSIIFKGFKHKERIAGGIGLFLFLSEYEKNTFEIRPHQNYGISFNISPRFNLGQLLRLEERFLFSDNEKHDFFGLRFRYQVTGTIDLQGLFFQEKRGFYLPISVEAFFNIFKVSQFNDVIRITPGIGYQIDPDFKLLASLAYHYTKAGIDSSKLVRTNDIVFRFRIIKGF